MSHRAFTIVAPACSDAEVELLAAAGADELYCGHLPDGWLERYGDADWATRRQGTVANVRRVADLQAMVDTARERRVSLLLTLNARYSRGQDREVAAMAAQWETMGGHGVVTADVPLLARLAATGSGLRRHLSVLGAVLNSQAARFWQELGVLRAVLPRSLAPAEIGALARGAPGLELEVITLHQRCPFVDGLCGFYHATRYPERTPCAFEYTAATDDQRSVIHSHDPAYEGHGCGVEFTTDRGRRVRLSEQDPARPCCGLCHLPAMLDAGASAFKIAGRGFPATLLVQAVKLLAHARRNLPAHGDDWAAEARRLYRRHIGQPCSGDLCYHGGDPWGEP